MTRDQFNQRIRKALDDEISTPDALLSARLRAARMKALERVPRRRWRYENLVPLGTAAAGIVVALTFMLSRPAPNDSMPQAFELLAASPDIEIVEDLEFYEWLESLDHAG